MPSRSDSSLLVGKRIEVSIGEPWDFSSTAGENRLEGKIVAVSSAAEVKPWILCEVSLFKHGQGEISQIVAVNRYTGSQDFLKSLEQGQFVGSNLFYRPDGEKLLPDQVTAWLESGTNQSFLIGSIKLIQSGFND